MTRFLLQNCALVKLHKQHQSCFAQTFLNCASQYVEGSGNSEPLPFHQSVPPPPGAYANSDCPAPNGWCPPPGNGSRSPAGSRQTQARSAGPSPWGSTVLLSAALRKTRWPVPQRWYSPSRRATRPGLMAWGGRTSWWSTTGFSSTQTTGSLSAYYSK